MNCRMSTCYAEDLEGNVEVALAEDVETMIDSIEKSVNEALSKIEDIEGIDSIDECKTILNRLSSDLY